MTKKTYPLDQSPFYMLNTKKKLASLLNISYSELLEISRNTQKFYREFDIPKGNGDTRHVHTPVGSLKKIQRRILNLLQRVSIPEWVIAGVSGKSYITNSHVHQKSRYILKLDIKNFYGNCTRDRVYRLFKDTFKTSSDVAEYLSNITTLESIPTGSPTSQLLAFLAYKDMFDNIYELGNSFNCTTTLYVDDLIFSNTVFFKHQKLVDLVRQETHKFNHELKKSKIMFYDTNIKSAIVTGVAIQNRKLKIPNKLRKKIITTFDKSKRDTDSTYINSLRGQVQAAKRIEKGHFNGIDTYLKES